MRAAIFGLIFAASATGAACSSSSSPVQGPPASCEAAGLTSPSANGQCAVGTCLDNDAGVTSGACCSAVCPTCESEGYVSFTDAGACPPGTCESGDVTAALTCCGTSVCGETDAGLDAPAESGPLDSGRADSAASDGAAARD